MKIVSFYNNSIEYPFVTSFSEIYLIDHQNNKYADLISSGAVVNIGHKNLKMISYIEDISKETEYVFQMFKNKSQARLGDKLEEITNNDFFYLYRTTSGTESVEIAIQIGLQEKGGGGVLFLRDGYHGNSFFLSILFSSLEKMNIFQVKIYEKKIFSLGIDLELDSEGKLNSIKFLSDIEKLFKSGKISLFLLEPFVSFSRGVFFGKEVLQEIRKLCDIYGVLLIFDEVVTGFGRFGTWFAYQHYSVIPDLLCCAKGITSGYAQAGCVMVRDSLKKEFSYYSTFAWSGISAEIGLKNIEILKDIISLNIKNKSSEIWLQTLKNEITDDNFFIQGDGFLFAIHSKKKFNQLKMEEQMLSSGIILAYPTDTTIIVCPPLCLSNEQIIFFAKNIIANMYNFFTKN